MRRLPNMTSFLRSLLYLGIFSGLPPAGCSSETSWSLERGHSDQGTKRDCIFIRGDLPWLHSFSSRKSRFQLGY